MNFALMLVDNHKPRGNMTIEELINRLSKLDKSLPVVVCGYEGGFDDVIDLNVVNLDMNINHEEYMGRHEESQERTGIDAVFLRPNRR